MKQVVYGMYLQPLIVLFVVTIIAVFFCFVDFLLKAFTITSAMTALRIDWWVRRTVNGGVLLPLLWVITINQLLLCIETDAQKVILYADDVAVVV